MVITTGEFTKSAIQLAMSNRVEIWDNTKLEKTIKEINNSSKVNTKESYDCAITKKGISFPCTYCKSSTTISIKNLPALNDQIKIKCPECDVNLFLSIPEHSYSCNNCNKKLETIKEKVEHSKKCQKLKEIL